MKVTAHRLFGHRHILREIQHVAPSAADLVTRNVRGRLPRVDIVLTTPQGMTELTVDTEIQTVGGKVTPQARRKAANRISWNDRRIFGKTVLAPKGAVLILINARRVNHGEQVAPTLVHELVHAVQFTRPGIADLLVAGLKNNFGIEPLSRRDVRRYEKQLKAHEDEAYRMEHRLTGQFNAYAA
ncbi:hypothetical protein [Streptomyces indicus]|uniref:Uncharacterized protein n=1 Tax=Streptomyces indicus TaxID=417292 RepID=A0A1G9ETQ4_9ACTN|nr:hypothetical protein [Streptomyces indicus]SDK79536.1 hypothetical protein SAMN05421806_11258 [Streptomyces indicus]